MAITMNPGEALKNKIKHETEERVSVNYLSAQLEKQQQSTPLDYAEVLGLLLSPFIGYGEVFTLKNALEDITAATMEVLREASRLEAAKSPTFTKTLGAVHAFLNYLHGLADDDDHLFTIVNLYHAKRWRELTPEKKYALLDGYGTKESD